MNQLAYHAGNVWLLAAGVLVVALVVTAIRTAIDRWYGKD